MRPHPLLARLALSTTSVVFFAGLTACASNPPVDAQATLARADKAMGASTVKTIRFAGSGTGATFGQAFEPGMAWPKINYSTFARVADYERGAFREDAARTRAEPTGGGAVPLMGTGEQRTTGLLLGRSAWNMVGPAPQAAALAATARSHDLWTSPHGIIKAALKHNATAQARQVDGKTMTAISFTVPGTFTATALVGADGLVERVESMQPNAVLGDTPSVIQYSDYKEVAGIKFPMRIRQSLGGFEVLDLTVTDVQANLPVEIEVPALVTAATERVAVDKVADGVWFLGGGSHNSVAIEMADHLMMVESPLFDGRALPVISEVKKLGAGKGIRYVINSHHHFDHAGGLRTAVAEGAELVTSGLARPYYERIMKNPNSISPDALQKSGRSATISGVDTKRVFADGKRQVEVHYIQGSVHSQGFMMVYLPAEKLLIQADAFTPGAPGTPAPARANDLHVSLVQNIERLKLDVERILPLHGRVVPISELYTAIGRKS